MPTMQAATYRRVGGPDVVQIEHLPIPTPGAHDVLVRVQASTVSVADYRTRSRDIPKGLRLMSGFALGFVTPRTPVLGMDAAGVVTAVGEQVTRFQPGDEVIAMLGGKFGGHAEYVVIPEDGAITTKPASMSFDEAVTLVFGGITARGFLNQVTIKPGDSVLVNGASGAVGTAMVQLAKQLGADVTGVCSAGNAELVSSLGADRVIDYTTVDFLAEGTTYDVIVDCVGNADFARAESSVKPGGALLLVVTDLAGVFRSSSRSRRTGKLITAQVGPYKAEDLAFLVKLADAGQYRAVIDSTYELGDIVSAHRYVATGRKRGNVVLRIA